MQNVNGYGIVIEHRKDLGTLWIVRTYKRTLLCKHQVSSDWFLDEDQARLFAKQLSSELELGADLITYRQPGWILRRPAR